MGTAETEIAEKFAKASEQYRDNPVALHLRAMNMVYEGLRQKGSMITRIIHVGCVEYGFLRGVFRKPIVVKQSVLPTLSNCRT